MHWRDYQPADLEREYTPASRVENIQIYLDDYATRGTHARQTISHQLLSYGSHPDEWLWHAPIAPTPNTPMATTDKLFVFVHGGFWRRLSADDGTFMTPAWHARGYNTASINYSLCPSAPLETLVDQTSRAINYLARLYQPQDMLLVGHSAGAHLVAMAICEPIKIKYAGALLVSGIFDLEPIVQTSINNDIKLTTESARILSPINKPLQTQDTPLAIVWGENETDEFKRQSLDFASAWSAVKSHRPAQTKQLSGRNHFDVLNDLTNSDVIDLLGAQKP